MSKLNIVNKKLFISVLNNLAGINPTVVIDKGTNHLSVRNVELFGRRQAIVEFSNFEWNKSFLMDDITKLTSAMSNLPDSEVELNDDKISVQNSHTEYGILYSDMFNDADNVNLYKIAQSSIDESCIDENLIYEFDLSDSEMSLIKNSEKILNFRNKYILTIDEDGSLNGKGIDGDKIITYTNTFRMTPANIHYNNMAEASGNVVLELQDLLFLPKYNYRIKVYGFYRQDRTGRDVRCYTIEASYSDDDFSIKYYTNTHSVEFR